MTDSERELLLLLAAVIGPSSSVWWREIRALMAAIREQTKNAN